MKDQWRDRLRVMEAWYDDLLGVRFRASRQQLLWDHPRLCRAPRPFLYCPGDLDVRRRRRARPPLPARPRTDYWVVHPSATCRRPIARVRRQIPPRPVAFPPPSEFCEASDLGLGIRWSTGDVGFNHAGRSDPMPARIGRVSSSRVAARSWFSRDMEQLIATSVACGCRSEAPAKFGLRSIGTRTVSRPPPIRRCAIAWRGARGRCSRITRGSTSGNSRRRCTTASKPCREPGRRILAYELERLGPDSDLNLRGELGTARLAAMQHRHLHRLHMTSTNDIRRAFLDYFEAQGPRARAVGAAGAAQRPDLDVRQRRHGAVQERLHRARNAALLDRRQSARNASAPAASTTTSTMSATPRATTPSSKCSAISRSATISRSARSRSPGTC